MGRRVMGVVVPLTVTVTVRALAVQNRRAGRGPGVRWGMGVDLHRISSVLVVYRRVIVAVARTAASPVLRRNVGILLVEREGLHGTVVELGRRVTRAERRVLLLDLDDL